MSDLITRIAARAVGAPPAARPRLPAFFGGDAPSLEIVDEQVVAPPTRTERPRSDVQDTAREQASRVEPPTVDTVTKRVESTSPPETLVRETVRSVERTIPEREPSTTPVPALPREPDEIVRAEHAMTVQATPVVTEAAVAPSAPGARAAEPPPVRVHIGRLEVRANLQQAPPQPQPRREAPRAPELTLADYLRGKREAG